MLHPNVVEGLHWIEDGNVNWYLVEDGERLTVLDTGLPRSWQSLRSGVDELGRSMGDIEAVVVTHGHFDHMGFANRAQRELGVDLWAPAAEEAVRHPWRYERERSRIPYLRNPAFLKIFSRMVAMGALWVKGTKPQHSFSAGDRLDIPGRPRVISTPGHTEGHCSLLFDERGAVVAGDAFVMLDPYTGREGPCVVAGAATADSELALSSLNELSDLDANIALTGHGPPWRGEMREAVGRAQTAGAA